jgi:hypothetical protein
MSSRNLTNAGAAIGLCKRWLRFVREWSLRMARSRPPRSKTIGSADGVRIIRASQVVVSVTRSIVMVETGFSCLRISALNIDGAQQYELQQHWLWAEMPARKLCFGDCYNGGSGTAADNGNSGAKSFGATLTVMVAQGTGNTSFGPVTDGTVTISPITTVAINSQGCIDNTN